MDVPELDDPKEKGEEEAPLADKWQQTDTPPRDHPAPPTRRRASLTGRRCAHLQPRFTLTDGSATESEDELVEKVEAEDV